MWTYTCVCLGVSKLPDSKTLLIVLYCTVGRLVLKTNSSLSYPVSKGMSHVTVKRKGGIYHTALLIVHMPPEGFVTCTIPVSVRLSWQPSCIASLVKRTGVTEHGIHRRGTHLRGVWELGKEVLHHTPLESLHREARLCQRVLREYHRVVDGCGRTQQLVRCIVRWLVQWMVERKAHAWNHPCKEQNVVAEWWTPTSAVAIDGVSPMRVVRTGGVPTLLHLSDLTFLHVTHPFARHVDWFFVWYQPLFGTN